MHYQAANWAGITVEKFDSMDMWDQAEIIAGYLTEGRIEEVQMHASKPSRQPAAIDPFEGEEE